MSSDVYSILQYPDKLLSRPGKQIEKIDANIKSTVAKLYRTLAAQSNCAALAATQLGVELCITVINHSIVKDGFISCTTATGDLVDFFDPAEVRPVCLINPVITARSTELVNEHEGCMSVGGKIYEPVKRNKQVTCEFLTENNLKLILVAEGFLSRCIQHELDHLQGKIFLDRLSSLKRKIVDRKFLKRVRKAI